MSTTIDQRVVEMRFDNKQFESNVNTSISTLDKLKQKLNLSGASKGLENINAAAKNNNLSALGNAASTVASRFSAMEVMGVTALANITNSAVNAGKRMVAALTIDPVKTGFNEYELKMDSVRTIMASTGKDVKEVNKYLNELNEYSDQTIYSFSDMTQNIGKFTNAGVKLEDAVMAIKGISNEAAVSGANANEASRAMYNFAQALSAGYVKLIDWKSIENANMATVEFKQELIDMAVKLGTVTKSADGMYQTLDGNAFSATKNFNEVLQDQWMTSDVLIETLKRYADETTDIGKKAKGAAQDVTKLSQVFDIAKETAQSGWAKTWELMFGDINQAKAFFTPISNAINGVIDNMSDFRNSILEGALGTPFQGLSDTFKKLSSAGKEVTDTTKDMEDAINRVLGGEFGDGQERWDKLTKAGYDWAAVQNKVNEKLGSSVRHTSKLSDAQKDLSTSQGLAVEQMLKMTDAQLMNLGFSKEEIKVYRELEKEIAKTGHTIGEVIDNPEIMSGRNLLSEAFKNLGSAMSNVMSTAKKAWKEIFPPKAESAIERGSKGLYGIIVSLHTFARRMNDLSSNKETIDKLSRTFKGLFAAIDIVTTVVAGPFKLAFKILKAILGAFNLDILDFTAFLGDGIVGFRNFIKNCNFLERGIKAVIPLFTNMVDAVRDWIDGMKEAENIPLYIIQGLVNGLKNGVKSVVNGVINLAKTVIETFCNILGIESPSKKFFELGGYVIQGFVNGLKNGFSTVWNVIKNFGAKCVEVLSNIDWGRLFTLGALAGFLAIAYKFASAFNKVANAFDGLGEMFEDIGKGVKKALNSFSGLMKGLKFKFMAEGIKDLAISVAILVGAIIALTFVKPEKLWPAVLTIVALVGILGLLAWAMNKISDMSMSFNFKDGFQSNGGFGGALLALGATLLILIGVTKMIGKMDPEQAKQGFKGLLTLMGILVGVYAAFSLTAKFGGNVDKVGSMFLKLSIAMLLLIGVVKLVSKLEPEEMFKGALAMAGFTLFVSGLVKATRGAGKNIDKIGGMLIKISFAMALMVGVVKLISKLKWSEMGKGAVGMVGFALFVKLLVKMAKGAGKNISKVGGLLFSMSASMLIMVGIIKLIGSMEWSEIGKGLVGILALTGIMGLMVKMVKTVGKDAPKMAGTLFAMSLSIGIIAGIAVLLSLVDTKNLVKGIIAVGLLSGIMSMMIHATKGAKNCMANLIVMTSAIILLSGAIALLSLIDSNKLITSTACLSTVMGVFAVLIASTKQMKSSKTLTKSMLTMLGVVAALALIVAALSLVNPANALGNVAALSVLMVAFSASLMILGKAGGITKTVTKNLLPMLGIVTGLAVILGVLGALKVEASLQSAIALGVLLTALSASLVIISYAGTVSSTALIGMLALSGVVAILAIVLGVMSALNVEGSIQTAISIGILLTAMSAALVIASYAGPNALMSVASLALMAVVVGLLGVVLGLMAHFNVEPSIETAAALSLLLIAMSASLVLLAGVGLLGPAALIGIASLAALIVGIGGLIVGIGALFDKFPMLEEFLDKGIPILQKIGEGLGKFFGGIVGGFMEGVADSLPHLGQCLSDFMTNVQPFVDGVKSVDSTALAGIGILAAAIVALTAADLIAGIASFVSGGDSFSSLGTELSAFITNAKPFIEGIKSIDASAVDAVKSLAEAILIITAADLLNGITSFITGEASLSKFASELPLLGTGIKGLVDNIGETDITKVGPVANAVKALAQAAKEIPNAGGLLAELIGDNELGTFAAQFPKVGTGIRKLIENLGEADLTKVGPAAEAVKKLAQAAKEIPNAGGLLASLVGDNELGTFATQFPKVGIGIKGLIVNLGEVDVSRVEPAAKAVTTLAKAAKDIPNAGGILAGLVGDNEMGTFATQFPKVGIGIKGLVTNLGDVDVSKVEPAAKAVATLAKVANDIPNSGGLLAAIVGENDLGTFAEQFPKVGTGLGGFAKNLGGGFDPNIIKTAVSAIEDLIDIGEDIEDNDGLADTENISAFGTGISNLAGYLKSFYDTISKINFDTWRTLITRLNSMSTIATYDTEGLKELGGNFVSMAYNLETGYGYISTIDMETFKNVLSSISSMSDTIASAIAVDASGLPAQGENFSIFGSKLRSGYENISHISVSVLTKVIESFDDVVGAANGLTSVDTEGISAFSDALNELGDSVSEFVNSSSTFKSSGADIVASIADGIDGKAGILVRGIGQILEDMYKKVIDKRPSFKAGGVELMEKLIAGISGKKSEVKNAATSSLASAVSGVRGYRSNFYNAGKYLVEGFANGIDMNMYKASAKAAAMAKAAVEAAEEALGINSPSRVFREIGNFAGLGFVNALRDYSSKTYDAGSEMADSARSGLKDSINKVLGLISGTMDAQPTIRPVLDLSGVESGMGAIGSMFNNDASIGVTSHLRAIDSSMSHYGQNGGNSDLISEIRKLRGELKNAGGTTNYINGITYDDGSNISSAIETIVRAARVERRV